MYDTGKKNLLHVVEDMGIDIRFWEGKDLDEANPKHQSISEIIEPDKEGEE